MNMLRRLTIAAMFIGALAIASCWYAGQRIEDGFTAQLAHFQHPHLQASLLDYRRGLLRSEARSQWQYQGQTLTLQHRIQHGPLPLGNLARIHSQFEVDPGQPLHVLLGSDSALQIHSRVHLNGNQQHRFSSAPGQGLIDSRDGPIAYAWGGLQAELHIQRGPRTIAGQLDMPSLQLGHKGDDEGLILTGLQLQLDAQQQAQSQVWTGPLQLQLQTLRVDHPIEPARLEGLSLHLESSIDGERLDISHRLQLAQLSFEASRLDDLQLDVRLGQLDARAFASLLKALNPSQEASQLQQQLLRSMPELLVQQPYLALQQLRFTHPQGSLQLSARLDYQGNGNLMQFRPAQELVFHAQLRASAELLKKMIAVQQQRELSRLAELVGWDQDSEDFQSLLDQSIHAQQQLLLQRGWLLEDGEDWLAEARFTEGQLRINGQPANALRGEVLKYLLR
ncbi:MAG: YdgA family protein [Gammaproteobacteria bacterium]|nr:YdgA family protein [Gammaproteobacteria bacterium]